MKKDNTKGMQYKRVKWSFFLFLSAEFLCIVVAICDIVHDVETIVHLC